jgi:hypothetical protein
MARADTRPTLVLANSSDLRLRYYARAAGFTGPLRADLSRLTHSERGTALFPPPSPMGSEALVAALRSLLPGVEIEAARRSGVVRSLFRGASSGVARTVHITATGPSDARPLMLAVPLGDEVLVEGVALTIDTALSVRRRFRPDIERVRVFFDHAVAGLRDGTIAGVAEPTVRDVHLNPAYASVPELEVLDRQRWERSLAQPSGRRPLSELPPFTRIDSVVAHEFWHQIEFGLESGRYRDSVEFRRAIGRYFGVETLEHVIKGGRPDAPLEWQAARRRLAEEVSGYATTAPKEATAELFAQWWCTPADPPPPAQFFGSLLRQFFPAADLVR